MVSAAKSQARAVPTSDEPVPLPRLQGEEPPLMLALDDLVRDRNGEVVLFNDSGLRALALSTDSPVIEDGEAGRHVTAAGEDVSGFRYLLFANGLRLYFQPGLDVLVQKDEART